jgi:hypothetical protein
MVKYSTQGEEGHFCTLSYLKIPVHQSIRSVGYHIIVTTSVKLFRNKQLLYYSARKLIFEDFPKLIRRDTYTQKILFKINVEEIFGRQKKKAKNFHPL